MKLLLILIFVSSTFSFDIFERFMPFSGTVDTSLSINSTGSSTWNNLNVTGTLTGANVNLNSGNIDGIAIGQTTPSNAIFGITTSTTAYITTMNAINANITTINATNVNATSITKAAFNTPTITLSQDTDFVLSGGVNGLSVDGTTFSVDGLNNRIGIGISSPTAPLDFGTNFYSGTPSTASQAINKINLLPTGGNPLYGLGMSSNSLNIVAGEASGKITLWTGGINANATLESDGGFVVGSTSTSYEIEAATGQVAGAGAYVNTSDKRLKKDVEPIQNACAKVMQLEPVLYNWRTRFTPEDKKIVRSVNFYDSVTKTIELTKLVSIDGERFVTTVPKVIIEKVMKKSEFTNNRLREINQPHGQKDIGFLAQDVETLFPQAVSIDERGKYLLAYSKFIPLQTACIQEQQQELTNLKVKLQSIVARLDLLERQ